MKLQIDTKEKTIKIEETVNLEKLFETLEKLLPKGEWKLFSLEMIATIVWDNPITVPYYPYQPVTPYPWFTQPPITYMGTDYGMGVLSDGTYCVEVT